MSRKFSQVGPFKCTLCSSHCAVHMLYCTCFSTWCLHVSYVSFQFSIPPLSCSRMLQDRAKKSPCVEIANLWESLPKKAVWGYFGYCAELWCTCTCLSFLIFKVHCIDPNVMVYGDPGCYPKACIRAHQRAVREGPLRDSLTFSKVCLYWRRIWNGVGDLQEIMFLLILLQRFNDESCFLQCAGFWWSIGRRCDAMEWIGRAQTKCGAATATRQGWRVAFSRVILIRQRIIKRKGLYVAMCCPVLVWFLATLAISQVRYSCRLNRQKDWRQFGAKAPRTQALLSSYALM